MAASLAYLDSCIVIYLIEGNASVSQAVSDAMRRQTRDAHPIAISDLTRLECRVGPLRREESGILFRYETFFRSRDLVHLPMIPHAFDLATELRAKSGLKTPDALHLATALVFECDEFWTNDRRLAVAGEDRIRIRTLV